LGTSGLEALARDFLVAYEQKRISSISEMFADDVILRDWNGQVFGRKAAILEYSKNFEAAKTLRINVSRFFQSGNSVAAEIEIVIDEIEVLSVVDVITFNEQDKINSVIAYKDL
jgi:hypothetical protein